MRSFDWQRVANCRAKLSEAAPSKQQGANLQLDLTSNTSAQRTRAAQSRRRFDRSFGWSARSSSPSLNSNMQEKKNASD